ncbi:MAG: hypothetical protein DYG99_13375 [Bacteroidetes bacterium CHB5]|nr:hypothetical protein [Bacteroidetes bacterium CHB5]
MKYILILILLFLFEGVSLQENFLIQRNYPSKKDTVLYLYFDKGSNYKITKNKYTSRFYQNEVFQKREWDCGHHTILEKVVCPPSSYIIDNIPFKGQTTDGYNLKIPDTVKRKELKKYRVVRVQELNHFFKTEYVERYPKEYMPKDQMVEPIGPDPMGSESYWMNLKKIYIVEQVRKNRFSITEVNREVVYE